MNDELYTDGRIDHSKMVAILEGVVNTALDRRLVPLERGVEEIRTSLTGNGLGTYTGLITEVKNLCESHRTLQEEVHGVKDGIEKAKTGIRWFVIGASLGMGGVGGLVVKMLVG